MPAINKKKKVAAPVKSAEKSTKPSASRAKALKKKTPKAKLISSQVCWCERKFTVIHTDIFVLSGQLGVTAVKKAKNKNAFDPIKANRGVVFIKHIPHGFYEQQLKDYFSQFGAVTRTRVARSDRSGKSKGYAYVEFSVPEVAEIAAQTMDNYLMFKQVLKTAYIAPEQQKFNYFRTTVRMEKDADGVTNLVTPQTMRTDKEIARINAVPSQKQHDNRVERALYK